MYFELSLRSIISSSGVNVWNLVGEYQVSTGWFLTPTVGGSLFRISQSFDGDNPALVRGLLAQSFEPFTTFDERRIVFTTDSRAFLFVKPDALSSRKLAFKRLDNSPGVWTIQVEQLEGVSDISLPIDISDVTGLQAALDAKASATHAHAIEQVSGLQEELDDKASKTPPAWISLNLQTGYTATAPSNPTYRKHSNGLVEIKGDLTRAANASDLVAVLPANYRPSEERSFLTTGGTASSREIRVLANGEIRHIFGNTTATFLRMSIMFFAEQ